MITATDALAIASSIPVHDKRLYSPYIVYRGLVKRYNSLVILHLYNEDIHTNDALMT